MVIIVAISCNSSVEQGAEDVAGVGAAGACDFFGGAGGDDAPAVFTAFGTEIDDVVGLFDHVEVVFDHQNCVSKRDQTLEHVEQLVNVGEVQAGRRLVEDVDRATGGSF